MPDAIPVAATLVWPVRPNIRQFTQTITLNGRAFQLALSFPARYRVAADVVFSGLSWSQLFVSWEQPFSGSVPEMIDWARVPKNSEELLGHAERAQHVLVDLAKDRDPKSFDLECIRHFGPIDWAVYSLAVAGTTVFERIGSATAAQFRTLPSEMLSDESALCRVPFERRTWRRAYDLALSGYPTEASLLAAAVLDSALQKFLISTMKLRGVDGAAATELLRNTTTKRWATFLDSVLKLATGQSLREDDSRLFDRVKRVNYARNEAIHNGRELGRREALESLRVTHEVLEFLHRIEPACVEVPRWPMSTR